MIQRSTCPIDRSNHAGVFPTLVAVLLLALVAGSIPVTASAAPKGKLAGIRTAPHGDSLRVVLDLAGPADCVVRAVSGGNDWEIIVKGACPANPPPVMTPDRCLASIESSCDEGDMRVLLRSARPLGHSAFRMPARGGKPARFVVDLWPAGGEPANASLNEAPPLKEAAPEPVAPKPTPRRTGKFRILVDPGHGGDDPGARRTGIREKDIVLDVGRRVVALLNATPGFEARLSRDDDRRIPLRQRMLLAEKYEADAFISIHVNAANRKDAFGVEVFFLSMGGASDEASKELARLENEADPELVVAEDALLEKIPFSFDLRQSDTLLRSSRLAESVLLSFEASHLAASRGVKQAGFAVLKSFQVPSALVEIGFLSNPAEARRLKDEKHRQKLADCIVKGTAEYFERFARSKAAVE